MGRRASSRAGTAESTTVRATVSRASPTSPAVGGSAGCEVGVHLPDPGGPVGRHHEQHRGRRLGAHPHRRGRRVDFGSAPGDAPYANMSGSCQYSPARSAR